MYNNAIERTFYWQRVKCRIKIGPLGNPNGYCGVPHKHPLYGKDYSKALCGHGGCFDHRLDMELNVHGGVTYSGEGFWKDGLWYFGFDTGHLGDAMPQVGHTGKVWDSYAMTKELRSLAQQIADWKPKAYANRETSTDG